MKGGLAWIGEKVRTPGINRTVKKKEKITQISLFVGRFKERFRELF